MKGMFKFIWQCMRNAINIYVIFKTNEYKTSMSLFYIAIVENDTIRLKLRFVASSHFDLNTAFVRF